jgi:ABC-type sugar transport system ATPase subunit
MVAVVARGLSKRYPEGAALDDITFSVDDGEAMVVLGPSGSGKTTLLRLIAGLERPTEGDLLFDGVPVTDLRPSRRNVAVVFQNEVLYPTKKVRGNIAFPLRVRKVERSEITSRVEAEARAVGIARMLERLPGTLSAGHRQLVQLARAMVRAPGIFLIDEPLGKLDPVARRRLRVELRRLQQGYGVTAIYATHDQEDALALGDRIAIIDAGTLRQVGEGREVYERPVDTFVAQFIGTPAMSLLEGSQRSGGAALDDLFLPAPPPVPDRVIVGVRAQDWQITPTGIEGSVTRIEDHGAEVFVEVATAAGPATVRLTERVREGIGLRIAPSRFHLFDPDTGTALYHSSS